MAKQTLDDAKKLLDNLQDIYREAEDLKGSHREAEGIQVDSLRLLKKQRNIVEGYEVISRARYMIESVLTQHQDMSSSNMAGMSASNMAGFFIEKFLQEIGANTVKFVRSAGGHRFNVKRFTESDYRNASTMARVKYDCRNISTMLQQLGVDYSQAATDISFDDKQLEKIIVPIIQADTSEAKKALLEDIWKKRDAEKKKRDAEEYISPHHRETPADEVQQEIKSFQQRLERLGSSRIGRGK